mgnify:CR=1 FL=1
MGPMRAMLLGCNSDHMTRTKSPYEEAVAWTIALRDSPDDSELSDQFLDWFEESDEHQAAWAHVEQTRYIAEEEADYGDDTFGVQAPMSPSNVVNHHAVPSSPPQTKRRISEWTGAPIALAATALLLYVVPVALLSLAAAHMTGTGEIRRVTLEDGSIVTLGAKSAIAIGKHQRSIELVEGVAFCDVARNPTKPFGVSSDGISVRVRVTAFEVRQTQRVSAIAVAEGEVEVDNQSTKHASALRLQSGTRVDVNASNSNHPPPKSVVAEKIGSWKNGELSVNDWPIEDVVNALRRHYPGLLIIQPGTLRGGSVSGVYDLKKPLAALRLLAATRGLRVRQLPNLVTVISIL